MITVLFPHFIWVTKELIHYNIVYLKVIVCYEVWYNQVRGRFPGPLKLNSPPRICCQDSGGPSPRHSRRPFRCMYYVPSTIKLQHPLHQNLNILNLIEYLFPRKVWIIKSFLALSTLHPVPLITSCYARPLLKCKCVCCLLVMGKFILDKHLHSFSWLCCGFISPSQSEFSISGLCYVTR